MKTLNILGSCIAVCLLLTACTTPPQASSSAGPAKAAAPKEIRQNLRKGMSEAEIRAAWGEPRSVFVGPAGERVLVYEFDVLTTQRMVATAMIEVPFHDPVTGAYQPVKEPSLSPEKTTVYQVIHLLLQEDRLQEWTRKLGQQRTFN